MIRIYRDIDHDYSGSYKKEYSITVSGSGTIEQIAGALEDMAIWLRIYGSKGSAADTYEDEILCTVVIEKEG